MGAREDGSLHPIAYVPNSKPSRPSDLLFHPKVVLLAYLPHTAQILAAAENANVEPIASRTAIGAISWFPYAFHLGCELGRTSAGFEDAGSGAGLPLDAKNWILGVLDARKFLDFRVSGSMRIVYRSVGKGERICLRLFWCGHCRRGM